MVLEPPSRRQLLRWTGWFGVANVAINLLIASRYLWDYPFSSDVTGNIYVLLAFIAHAAFLAYLPLVLLVIPLLLVLPMRRPVITVAVIAMSFSVSLLILDTNVFAQNRYHLTWLTLEILAWHTLAFAGVFFIIALAFQSVLAGQVRNWLAAGSQQIGGRWIAIGLIACLLVSQSIHIWADAVGHIPVTRFTRYMPLYRPMKAKRILADLELVDPDLVQKRRLLNHSLGTSDSELRYPLNRINCRAKTESLPNILIVMIDALRPDVVHPKLLPNLAAFSQHASRFRQHYSGGNSTRMGLFSLFYGLPSTYWQSIYALQRPPVLMDQVRRNNYQMALFSAAGFGRPASLDRTAFVAWPGLPGKGADMSLLEQNVKATDDWLDWLSRRTTDQPIFAYLQYDPPKNQKASEEPIEEGDLLEVERRFINNPETRDAWLRYRQALQMVDHEFGRVLDSLESQSLTDNTIVIVTSDHGSEYDDNGLGYIGHGNAFSNAQLLSTMMIVWPGRESTEFSHRTASHDLPVTLLQEVFECHNPPREYSVGQNLFSGESWSWMIAGSYNSHAIIEPDQVIISHPGGFFEVRDRDYRPVSDSDLNPALIREAMEAQSRFLE
jgi:membrane-anchored protein YejM (alkaline phosphatase superfamily)